MAAPLEWPWEEEIERRRAYLKPLLWYLREHGLSAPQVTEQARLLSLEEGGEVPATPRLWEFKLAKMREGKAPSPPWFIEYCCRVLEKPVVEVMGAEWVKRFGEDGRGGEDIAPVREYKPLYRWYASWGSGGSGSDSAA